MVARVRGLPEQGAGQRPGGAMVMRAASGAPLPGQRHHVHGPVWQVCGQESCGKGQVRASSSFFLRQRLAEAHLRTLVPSLVRVGKRSANGRKRGSSASRTV
eukprot:scaffold574_cov246-Pinguiococcus_pyrenoidosus.AAC.10